MGEESDAGGGSLPQPARFWTVEQANGRLGQLSELLPQLRAWVVRLRRVHDELKRLAEFWGKDFEASDHPDQALRHRLEEEWQNLTRRLQEAVTSLSAEGIEVKNLDTGLLDFFSLMNGEVVFLCWQRGEEEVAFYHTLEGGYRSRRPLPHRSRRATPNAG